MTYEAQEASAAAGAPVWLYRFVHGSTVYRYTSEMEDITRDVGNGSETFTATAGAIHSEISQTQELSAATVTLALPRDAAVAVLFQASLPTTAITVTIYSYHRADAESVTAWTGRIRNVNWKGAEVEVICEPLAALLDRDWLHYDYGATCNNIVYVDICGVLKDSTNSTTSGYKYRNNVTVNTLSGSLITTTGATGRAAGFFNGGYGLSTATEYRMVASHTSTGITFLHAFESLSTGESLTLYAACDRTLATCISKFDNRVNYVGCPFVPRTDPHTEGLN